MKLGCLHHSQYHFFISLLQELYVDIVSTMDANLQVRLEDKRETFATTVARLHRHDKRMLYVIYESP